MAEPLPPSSTLVCCVASGPCKTTVAEPEERDGQARPTPDLFDSLGPEGMLYTSAPGDPSVQAEAPVKPQSCFSLDPLTPHGPRVVPLQAKPQPTPEGWCVAHHSGRTPEQEELLKELLREHADVYARDFKTLGSYSGREGPIGIKLTDERVACFSKPRRHNPAEDKIMAEKIGPLVQAGIVVPCPSAQYASNNVIVAKRDAEGNFTDARVCHNYRPVNTLIEIDSHRLPRTDELHQTCSGDRFFSKIDARSGFLQIPIRPEDQPKTAFWYQGQLWMYTRMPFGMKNSPAEFQKRMDAAIQDNGLSSFAAVYIDDLLIHSATFEEHLQHLQQAFSMLRAIGIRAHPGKSVYCAEVLEFLGHNISLYGISPSEAKVEAIMNLPAPTNVAELRQVMGFLNYYRGYVADFSALASPLSDLTKKDEPWQWRPEVEEAAWQTLKARLCDPACALRKADFKKPFIVHCDWSQRGIGAVLGQLGDDGQEYLVACASRSLNKHEKNYASFKGELLGAVWAVKTFDFYLRWTTFTLVTDHSPLVWLMTNNDLTGQYARWSLILQEYDFKVVHRPGVKHQNADTLSRFPLPTTADETGARMDLDEPERPATLLARLTPALSEGLWLGAPGGEIIEGGPEQFDNPHPRASRVKTMADVNIQQALAREPSLLIDPSPLPPEGQRHSFTFADGLRQPHQRGPLLQPACVGTALINPSAVVLLPFTQVTLLELFGGMCAGLEACLRQGIRVQRYIYCDISAVACEVAAFRMAALSAQYPALFPPEAFQRAFHTLPMDVFAITLPHLLEAEPSATNQWMVVAGWSCQDLSPAGTGRGLDGRHSRSFFPLVSIVAWLQSMMPSRPPIYLLENAAMQHTTKHDLGGDFNFICSVLGPSVCFDAAAVGSAAHRLRNYWTNLAPASQLQAVVDAVVPVRRSYAADILDAGRSPRALSRSPNPLPYHQANIWGQPARILPTLVSTFRSYAFRGNGHGLAIDDQTSEPVDLSIPERERALGYASGATAAPSLTYLERHLLTGQCMDANALQHLLAASQALSHALEIPAPPSGGGGTAQADGGAEISSRLTPTPEARPAQAAAGPGAPPTPAARPAHTEAGPGEAQDNQQLDCLSATPGWSESHRFASQLSHLGALVNAADQQEEAAAETAAATDIWQDQLTLNYLKHSDSLALLPPDQRRRVQRRAAPYFLISREAEAEQGPAYSLYRRMSDGTPREVPEPSRRNQVAQSTHERSGHFGRRRTLCLVMSTYYWSGMRATVDQVVGACRACSLVQAAQYKGTAPTLQPLPIMGLMYRWQIDLAGPFQKTARGSAYLMITVESFSKLVVLTPIPNKEAATITYAFHHRVLTTFGACAVVLTDNGTEFSGVFDDYLTDAYIDHARTSPHHPAANGLSERVVQTVKRCLVKSVASGGAESAKDWDLQAGWISMAYNAAKHETTGVSPYELMHGIPLQLPASAKGILDPSLDLDDVEEAAEHLVRRSQVIRALSPIAGSNTQIAQQRDTLRYARLRDNSYLPKVHHFQVGQFVYVKRPAASSLEPPLRPEVLRVTQISSRNVLTLMGSDGATTTENAANCTPCHLPIEEQDWNPARWRAPKNLPCEVCRSPAGFDTMLVCDRCFRGRHLECCSPKLSTVPEGDWYCPDCVAWSARTGGALVPSWHQGDECPEERALSPEPPPSSSPGRPDTAEAPRPAATTRAGRLVVKPRRGSVLTAALALGEITLAADMCSDRPFWAHYDDGSSEFLSKEQLGERLVPLEHEALLLTERAAVMAVTLAETRYDLPLPHSFQLTEAAGVLEALQLLMPGPWTSDHATRLSQPGGERRHQRDPSPYRFSEIEQVEAMDSGLRALLRAVAFGSEQHLADPFSGCGSIERVFAQEGFSVFSNDIDGRMVSSWHRNALQPVFYSDLSAHLDGLDVVIMSPPPRVLDLAFPLAVRHARDAVCCRVPCLYLTDAPAGRAAYLAWLLRQGRLSVLSTLPRGLAGRRCAWLCVFKNSGSRDRFCSSAQWLNWEL